MAMAKRITAVALTVVALAAVHVHAHVGFELEAIHTNVEHGSVPWYRRIISPKGYAMHTVANQWKLTVDHTYDAEYVTDATDETLAGRHQTCARLAAVAADANAAVVAHAAAIAVPGAAANAVWVHHGHNLRNNPLSLALQTTFGVQLGHVRRMLAAMNDPNWSLPLAQNAEWYTPFMAAAPLLWAAQPLNQLTEEQRGFVLLVAAMRAAGNSGDPDSPKKHMDFIVHTKWARIANELTAFVPPIGMAGPVGGVPLVTERAALLANHVPGPLGRPWCSVLAELLVNDALANHGWASQWLVWNPAGALAADMFAQGWTVWGMNMDPGFDVWVRGILTPSMLPGVYATDYLRNNPLTYFANTIGNLDHVDTVGGHVHIIIEMRKGPLVTHASLQDTGLALWDWYTRWNAWALAVPLVPANQPRRLMSVSHLAVAPGAAPFFVVAGGGCAATLQNTCQAGAQLGGTLAIFHAEMLVAETNRVNGVGGPACLLEHEHHQQLAHGTTSRATKRLRRKARARAHTHEEQQVQVAQAREKNAIAADAAVSTTVSESQCAVVPASRAWPAWPQPPLAPPPAKVATPNPMTARPEPAHGRTVADVLKENDANLKAHADQLPKELADALKWAQEHQNDADLHRKPHAQIKKP